MTVGATHFRELEVWQIAMLLAKRIYEITRAFPADERFGLASQVQRAAVSVPSNIAEGNARQAVRDYARFIGMASGSVAELQTQLLLARDLEFADEADIRDAIKLCERVSKMLFRLRESLLRHDDSGYRVPDTGYRARSR